MKVKVVAKEDLRSLLCAGEFQDEEVIFVKHSDGSMVAAIVISEGGGHNDLGGERTIAKVLEGEVLACEDVPIRDIYYHWWRRYTAVTLPALVEYEHERWGAWSPNRYQRYRKRYRWGSEPEVVSIYEEVDV